jgi:hypothetical protein
VVRVRQPAASKISPPAAGEPAPGPGPRDRQGGSVPQEPSPRSPKSASPWRLGDLCDLGKPLRQGDQLGRGLVRRRPSGRELLLVGLPCCGPFARQGGQSGYRAVGPLPFGNEIAVEPLVVRL